MTEVFHLGADCGRDQWGRGHAVGGRLCKGVHRVAVVVHPLLVGRRLTDPTLGWFLQCTHLQGDSSQQLGELDTSLTGCQVGLYINNKIRNWRLNLHFLRKLVDHPAVLTRTFQGVYGSQFCRQISLRKYDSFMVFCRIFQWTEKFLAFGEQYFLIVLNKSSSSQK